MLDVAVVAAVVTEIVVVGMLVGRGAWSIGGGVSIIAVGDTTPRVLDLTTNADDPTMRKAKMRLVMMLFMMLLYVFYILSIGYKFENSWALGKVQLVMKCQRLILV